MKRPPSLRAALAHGFTLIELLVVIMILATLAGLAISRVDWARRSADTATAAAGISQAHENVQIFRTMKGVYPDRFDSLLDSTTVGGTAAMYPKLFGAGSHSTRYSVTTFPVPNFAAPGGPTGPLFSLVHAGISQVMDHDPAATFPSDSGTSVRDLVSMSAPAPQPLVTIKVGSAVEKALYPEGIPVDTNGDPMLHLVALGLGPSSTLNGATMANAPLCTAIDPTKNYGRFIAIFAAFESGKRAELKAVIDSTGLVAGAQLNNYYQSMPE